LRTVLLFTTLVASAGLASVSRGACVIITKQPDSVLVQQGCRATFQVEASGSEPLTYQWFEEGRPIPGATNAVYNTSAVRPSNDGNAHIVVLSNACGSVQSDPAVLTVLLETAPPALVGAEPGGVPEQIAVKFKTGCSGLDGGLDLVSGTNTTNYIVSGGLQVLTAELACEGSTVILTVASRPAEGLNYTVTVTGVKDVLGNPIQPGSQASFRANALFRGALRRELIAGLTAGTLTALSNDLRFPYCPDQVGLVYTFEAPRNVNNRYGQRILVFVTPPVKTNYTFFLAADDQSLLFLSSDETVANKRLIARVTQPQAARNWACSPGTGLDCLNRSEPIALENGRRYYIEAVMVESTNTDHVAVAWSWSGELPSEQLPPIPAAYLSTYGPAGAQITITQHPQNATATPNCRASFSVAASVQPAGIPVTYQWQRFSVDIPGANQSSYVTGLLSPTNNGSVYRCMVRGPGVSRSSANAILTVTGDAEPPQLTGLAPISPTRLIAFYNVPVGLQAGTYSLSSGQPTSTHYFQGNPAWVEISVGGEPLSPGDRYVLTVSGVLGSDATPLTPEPTIVSFQAQAALPSTDGSIRVTPAQEQSLIEWAGGGALEAADAIEGPWLDLPDAFSPLVALTTATPCNGGGVMSGQRFYRLRVGSPTP